MKSLKLFLSTDLLYSQNRKELSMSIVLSSKKVLVIGVAIFIALVMQTESFADQGWEVITQLPPKRLAFATAVVGHKVYLIGGSVFEKAKFDRGILGPYGISTVEVYDTQTNAWQKGTDMPTPRHAAKAAVVNGTIFVFGGWNGPVDFALRKYPVNVEAYNPRTDTWIQKQDMPVPRVDFDIGVVDGKIYLIGGSMRAGGGESLNRVDVYNPITDTWVKGREMPTPRSSLRLAVVGNRIYAIGGLEWRPRVNFGLTVIEEYDATSRQWQKRGDMLDTRDWFKTVVVRDSIYLIGGSIWKGVGFVREYLASVNVYDPQRDAWNDIPAMPMPLTPQGAAVVNGRVYVLGGTGDVGKGLDLFPDVLVYDTGFRAVEAKGKLSTRWGKLKAEPQRQHQSP